ncbi:MAG: CRTAC1 family protein, partial [Acidobacteria bacterium]
TGERWYCRPTVYKSTPSWLFHSNGDGTFTDVSKESGIAQALGKALGVVAADVNNDGWMDLFVGNDTEANFLWVNRGKGRFEETGALAGVGFSAFGHPRSGMGVDASDYDHDGKIDLFLTTVDHEMFSLYHQERDEIFSDVAPRFGIASQTFNL